MKQPILGDGCMALLQMISTDTYSNVYVYDPTREKALRRISPIETKLIDARRSNDVIRTEHKYNFNRACT